LQGSGIRDQESEKITGGFAAAKKKRLPMVFFLVSAKRHTFLIPDP
jgi:hypothetical protein